MWMSVTRSGVWRSTDDGAHWDHVGADLKDSNGALVGVNALEADPEDAYLRYQLHVGAYLYLVGNPFPGFAGADGSFSTAISSR